MAAETQAFQIARMVNNVIECQPSIFKHVPGNVQNGGQSYRFGRLLIAGFCLIDFGIGVADTGDRLVLVTEFYDLVHQLRFDL